VADRGSPLEAQPTRAVWGLCPGCGRWQVCVAQEIAQQLTGDLTGERAGDGQRLFDRAVITLVDDAFREHARDECPGLAELIAVRGMRAKPAPVLL
jgi:hypothetical protein